MPIIFRPGKEIKNYKIIKELNRGAFANAYLASSPAREKVFFKQYKSPTKLVEWYFKFVEHQKEIKRRIGADPAAKDRCYEFIEFFDDASAFYQVFEFVEGGKALTQVLDERKNFSDEQMTTFTKVMMFGIKALHQIGIVHTDLKPDNIILVPDSTIANGYKLRVIDLDWAIFQDQHAPWHGKQSYVGTPGYLSPEHIRSETPTAASDIFTCGIIIGQSLGTGHPFAESGDDYPAAALSARFKPIRIQYPVRGVLDIAFLEAIANSCLDPDPRERPTAAQICDAFRGIKFPWPTERAAAPSATRSPPLAKSVERPSATPKIQVMIDGRAVMLIGTDAVLGKQNFKTMHPESQFLSNPQFRLYKDAGQWMVAHCSEAINETIVDGRKLANPEVVYDGMRVAVGNSAKGLEKLPLCLTLVT